MKRAALLAIVLAGGGCGSDKAARQEGGPEHAVKHRHSGGIHAADPNPAGMTVENELGVLDTEDVEATMKDHFDDVRGCYHRAGKAQRYAGGRVMLRFLVGGDGIAQDVLVIESTLGNYDVERCLVEVGRRIAFHAPAGHKPTTFEYPVEFRSTNQLAVLEADGMKVDHDISVLLPQLAACGQLAAEDASAIIYIEPNGFPGSVGLAAGSTLDEDVGDCMVQTIRRWKMSVTLPNRVMRATFSIPPVIATAEATPRRTTAGHRRRH
ncbi:MAG TPA: TonB family protein [Polyangia bacterium]|jgi:TonB family protein|nr:TonB family protein [Polyangia bacterium]